MTEGEFDKYKGVDIKGSYVSKHEALDAEHKKVLKIPKNTPRVILSKKDILKYQQVAQNSWDEVYDPKRALKMVSDLASGDISKKKQEKIVQEFIDMRKVGQMLRSIEIAGSVSHKSSKEFHKLIVKMGKLKDYPGKEVKHAKKLKKIIKKYNKKKEKIDKSFKPCKAKGFRKHLRHTNQIIRGILSDDNPKDIELRHDLRKVGIRTYVNLFKLQLISDKDPGRKGMAKTKDAYFFFKGIDREIGKLHDKVYKDERKGKKATMKIDKKTKKRLLKGINELSDQWEGKVKRDNKKSQAKDKKKSKKKNK